MLEALSNIKYNSMKKAAYLAGGVNSTQNSQLSWSKNLCMSKLAVRWNSDNQETKIGET